MNEQRVNLSFSPTTAPEPEVFLRGKLEAVLPPGSPQMTEYYRPKQPYWSHEIERKTNPSRSKGGCDFSTPNATVVFGTTRSRH